MRQGAEFGDVRVVDAVAGVDLDAKTVRVLSGVVQPLQFPRALRPRRVGKCAGVQFDHLGV